jgi:hypothetical protein
MNTFTPGAYRRARRNGCLPGRSWYSLGSSRPGAQGRDAPSTIPPLGFLVVVGVGCAITGSEDSPGLYYAFYFGVGALCLTWVACPARSKQARGPRGVAAQRRPGEPTTAGPGEPTKRSKQARVRVAWTDDAPRACVPVRVRVRKTSSERRPLRTNTEVTSASHDPCNPASADPEPRIVKASVTRQFQRLFRAARHPARQLPSGRERWLRLPAAVDFPSLRQ